jgi:DNA-binding NarL/FixJ family response regulator
MRSAAPSAPDVPELRTLLVDDDPDQRGLVRKLFERAGIGPIEEAVDASQGLLAATTFHPDLVLLDIGMPGRSGLDVLPDLVEAVPDARIVVLSNFPRQRLGEMARAKGAVGYVEKRVAPERLVAEVLLAAAISEAAVEQAAELPADPTSPRAARALVRGLLGTEDVAFVESVELVVSELVTNAITHGRSSPRIEVALGRRSVRVAVHDDNPTLPTHREPDVDRPGGRGLHLVDHIASRWGSEPTPDGKVVWFEMDRPG